MALERSAWVEAFWKIHPWLYRVSGGRIGGRLANLPVLLLETVGRRSGVARTTALTYLPREGDFVVVASVLGEPRHPAWYLNLRATPDAVVTVGRKRIPVRARDAEGEERETIFSEIIARSPDYAEYRDRTSRRIPIVVLSPSSP